MICQNSLNGRPRGIPGNAFFQVQKPLAEMKSAWEASGRINLRRISNHIYEARLAVNVNLCKIKNHIILILLNTIDNDGSRFWPFERFWHQFRGISGPILAEWFSENR